MLIECLTEHLEEALRVASKIIQQPLISGLRVGRAKELMTANWKTEDDDAIAAARSAALRAFFGGRGYGSALFGTEESLKAIDRKDILAFVRRFVVKPNVFFCVVTDLEQDAVRRLLEAAFDSLADGEAAALPPQEPALPETRDINLEKDTKQTYIGRAYALPRRGLADMARGTLLESLLGKGPGSRLWALRGAERLAYSVDADLTWTKAAGILVAYLETGRAKAAEAAKALERTLEELGRDGIGEEEMTAARTMARARFLRAAEAKTPRLRILGLFETLGHGPDGAAGLLEEIEAVTSSDLSEYIRATLAPGRALSLTVGPAGTGRSPGGPSCPD